MVVNGSLQTRLPSLMWLVTAISLTPPEGGVDLAPYQQVQAWLSRIEAEPNFVGMAPSPIPELA